MIGQAQSQGGDAGSLKNAAESNLTLPRAVPLRQHDDRQVLACLEEPAANEIVFGIWSLDGAFEFENSVLEPVVFRRRTRIECRAIGQYMADIVAQCGRRVSVRLDANVIGSPVEGQ
jgi:hypothetical protein